MEGFTEGWIALRDWANLHNGLIALFGFVFLLAGGFSAFVFQSKRWDKLEGWLKNPVNYPELLNEFQNDAAGSYFRAIRQVLYWTNRTYGANFSHGGPLAPV